MIANKRIYLLFLLLIICRYSAAQIVLHAMVADSATLKPMSSVTVRVNHSHFGAITNERGYFVLEVDPHDTLVFSSVGYFTKRVIAAKIENAAVIYLTASSHLLKEVVINGNIGIPWLPKLPPENPYRNRTQDQRTTSMPGFQGVQTFGPGYVFKDVFLRMSRDAGEKRKLLKMQKEDEDARGYVALVNDQEVKGRLMTEYNLTEQEYFELLAKFNEQNKEFMYQLDDSELVTLIFSYFRDHAVKK